MCMPSYFYSVLRQEKGRLGVIKRENPKSWDKRWEPTASSRVCSVHFVDQKPTAQHSDATLNLGRTIREVKKRKLPSIRNNIVEVKRRSNVLGTHSIQTKAVSQYSLLHSKMLQASQNYLPASNTAQLHASDTAQLHASDIAQLHDSDTAQLHASDTAQLHQTCQTGVDAYQTWPPPTNSANWTTS